MVIGCDFHPRFQQIAYVDREAGDCGEVRLSHADEAERFYRALAGRKVRIGAESTGNFRWFRRLRHISKQGNTLLRWLLVEAAITGADGSDASWHRQYVRLSMTKHHGVAKVAIAHKLAVRLYWMLRSGAELQAGDGARFACGAVRVAPWRVSGRETDWTPRLSRHEERV